MINGTNSVASLLSTVYNTNNQLLAESLSRLASGKRIVNPSDDFGGYMKAKGYETEVAGYTKAIQDLTNAKGGADYAAQVGNDILEDISRMVELKDLHTNAAGDADLQAGYQAEYTSLYNRVNDTIADATYGGVAVYTTANISTTFLEGDGDGANMVIAATNVSSLTNLGNIGNATAADLDGALANAENYAAQMEGFSELAQRHIDLTNVIINSKEAAVSAIMNVDEMKELTKMTDLQVRQQAAVSMMAQANLSQQGLMRLYM